MGTTPPHPTRLVELSLSPSLLDIIRIRAASRVLANFLSKSGAFTKNGHNPPPSRTPLFLTPYTEFTDEPEDASG